MRKLEEKQAAKAREVLKAEQQLEDERFACITCSGIAQDQSDYCLPCEIYWEDTKEWGYE
jgi:hypothetical protein